MNITNFRTFVGGSTVPFEFYEQVQIKTGATGSPYAVAGLTGAAWAWSAWTACALPTDGTDQVARLTFEAKTTAGTVHVAAVVVEGVAP